MLNVVNAKDVLFFVGSGISSDNPSSLPMGRELTEFIVNLSCGETAAKAIMNTWKLASKEIHKYNPNFSFPLPRLEIICGCIYETDTIMNRNSILNGFSSFANIPYNYNHYILSKFLHQGATVLTTNFDLGIENAYFKNYNDYLYEDFDDNIRVFKTSRGGEIYHLHGRANDDICKLGATIGRVKNGLTNSLKEHLIEKINNAKMMIFLGYGVVDSFDITPLLESTMISGNKVIFVQHQNKGEKVFFPYYLDRITKSFKKKETIKNNTTEFLETLAKEYSFDINDYRDRKCENFCWEKEFFKSMGKEYSDDEKLMNYLGLRYQLGFNPRIVEKEKPEIIDDIKRLKEKTDTDNSRINDYFIRALRDFENPLSESFNKPDKTIENKIEFIDKPYIAMLRDECNYLLKKYNSFRTSVERKDKDRIDYLFDLLTIYSEFSYDKVEYISYIITCLKYKSLFLARFKRKNPYNTCEREILLSLEISHFEGVITALLHLIKSTILYNKTLKSKKRLKYKQLRKQP